MLLLQTGPRIYSGHNNGFALRSFNLIERPSFSEIPPRTGDMCRRQDALPAAWWCVSEDGPGPAL
jgi:hypothetical protein